MIFFRRRRKQRKDAWLAIELMKVDIMRDRAEQSMKFWKLMIELNQSA